MKTAAEQDATKLREYGVKRDHLAERQGGLAEYKQCSSRIYVQASNSRRGVDGLFRPHDVTWSEQQEIEFVAPEYLRNVIRIVAETGLRIYKELTPMKKEQLDLENVQDGLARDAPPGER